MSRHQEHNISGIPPWVGSLGIVFVASLFGMFLVYNSQFNDSRQRVTSIAQEMAAQDRSTDENPNEWKQFSSIQTSTIYEEPEEDTSKFEPVQWAAQSKSNDNEADFEVDEEIVPVSQLLQISGIQTAQTSPEDEEAMISEPNSESAPDLGDSSAFTALEPNAYMDIAFSSPQYVVKDVGLGFKPLIRKKRRKRSPLSGWFTMEYPLSDPEERDDGQSGVLDYPTLESTLQYKPNNWFFRLSFYSYLNEEDQRRWDPDYSYRFGYKNWRPNSFSLWYYNGGRNRLNPDRNEGETFTRPEDGEITFRYNLPKFSRLENLLKITSSSRLGANFKYRMIPRQDYWIDDTRYRMHWKQTASFYTWYNFTRRFYVGAQINYYPENNQRRWDPDFTYEIGLADWSPGKLSIEYGNYDRNNRFPWRNDERRTSLFDGSLSLSLYWRF